MGTWMIVVCLIVVAVVVLAKLGFIRIKELVMGNTEIAGFPYVRRQYLLTAAERSFYGVLHSALADRLCIFAKVRLADVLAVEKGTGQWQTHQNRIQSKHVAFVLCDPQTLSPVLGIEIDDRSHGRPARQRRDRFVEAAFRASGLPLLRIPVRENLQCCRNCGICSAGPAPR